MKKIITLFAVLITGISLCAQTPESMSYQAVIRNSSDQLVTNHTIGMRISILQGPEGSTTVYTEIHTPVTNANGLVSIEIGNGTIVSGDFATIDWTDGPYFIKTETDPEGGENYTITGTSQLLSVPYALHSKTAETVTGEIPETDPVFTAWDKSTGISISESQIGDLQTYLTSESDPAMAASFDFSGATAGDILQFDGSKWVKVTPSYLTGYTEIDPVFTAWDKSTGISISESQIGDLQTYLTSESDPVFGTSAAGGISTTDIDNWNGKQDQLTAGTGINIVGNTISATGGSTHYVGEFYGGGVVFWVDRTGEHGFILAMADLSTSYVWSNITTILGTTNSWDGAGNTTIITGQSGHTNSAAKLCEDYINNDYGTGIYSDWYLPSAAEMNLIWNSFYEVQKAIETDGDASTTVLTRTYYWSSSEYSTNAWNFSFGEGSMLYYYKGNSRYVRAIRAF